LCCRKTLLSVERRKTLPTHLLLPRSELLWRTWPMLHPTAVTTLNSPSHAESLWSHLTGTSILRLGPWLLLHDKFQTRVASLCNAVSIAWRMTCCCRFLGVVDFDRLMEGCQVSDQAMLVYVPVVFVSRSGIPPWDRDFLFNYSIRVKYVV
jgi:hypothetical protein